MTIYNRYDLNENSAVQNKAIIRSAYRSFVKGDLGALEALLHAKFAYKAPHYFPWGGSTMSPKGYLEKIVPQLRSSLDFGKFRCVQITAEDDRVVALVEIGIVGREDEVILCDQWSVENGKIRFLLSSCFEPLSLLISLEARRTSPHHASPNWSAY